MAAMIYESLMNRHEVEKLKKMTKVIYSLLKLINVNYFPFQLSSLSVCNENFYEITLINLLNLGGMKKF